MRFFFMFVLMLVHVPAISENTRHLATARDGKVIEYLEWGRGPAIVMVASLGRGAEDFSEIASKLSDRGFRVIAPEPRGVGRSDSAADGFTLHDYAADVASVIEYSGASPVVVLGHAYGNTVARTLATDRPDLVQGVILVAASGRAPISSEIRKAIANASNLAVAPDVRLSDLKKAYFAEGSDAGSWLGGWYPIVQASQWQAFNASKPDDYLSAGGHVPILAIHGQEDVIVPLQVSQDLKNTFGDRVSVVLVPHAGHALIPEQPALIVQAIIKWFDTTVAVKSSRTPR